LPRPESLDRSLAPFITLLNRIRAEHPALGQLRNLDIHTSDDDSVLVFSKYLGAAFTGTGQADALIIVVNVDPHSVRETLVPPRRYEVRNSARRGVRGARPHLGC